MRSDPVNSVRLRDPAVFYAVALGLAVLVALASIRTGSGGLLGLYMFTPMAALAAMQLLTRGNRGWRTLIASLGLGRAGFAGWPFALLVPPVLIGLVTMASAATGAIDLALPPDRPSLLVWPMLLAVQIALNCVFAFGEEVGWRGWLLGRLLPLGVWPAMLVTGFLHGAWHLPVILLTPYYHGEGSPWIIVPGFLAALTLAGVSYGYLRLSTGSLWPAVILHSALNVFLGQAALITAPSDTAMADYLGGESGIFTILALGALSLLIARGWKAGRIRAA